MKLQKKIKKAGHQVIKKLPAVLRVLHFRRLWGAQAISQFGDALYYMVFLFVIDKVTRDSNQTAIAGALMQLPFLIFGLHAGLVADRIDRRKIMLWSDIVSAVLMLGLLAVVIVDRTPQSWILLLVGFLLSTIAAFFDPARQASVPSLVPSHLLTDANVVSSSTKTFMQLIGPLLSTALLPLLASAGSDNFFLLVILVNLVSFGFSSYFIYRLPPIHPRQEEAPEHQPKEQISEIMQGLNYLRSHKVLRSAMFLVSFINFIVAPILVAYTAANREWFNTSETTFAGIQAAFFLGMLGGAALVMKVKVKRPGLAFCFGLGLVGVFIGLLSMAKWFWLFFAINFMCGLCVPFAVIPITTLIQLEVPKHLLGRVNSTINMLTNLLLPLGWLAAGQLTKMLGVQRLFIALGCGIFFTALIGLFIKPFRESVMPNKAAAE